MPAQGLKTWLPKDVKKQIYVTNKLTDLYSKWAYEPIEIPTLVDMKVLEQANIKFQEKTFKLADKDGEILALRPELTQAIARTVSSRVEELEFPQKLYYSSTVFRYSGKATDDSREILQTGVEYIGADAQNHYSDHEILYLFLESTKQFNLDKHMVTITHADIWNKIFELYHEDGLAELAYGLLLRGDILSFKKHIKEDHPLSLLIKSTDISEIEKAFGLDLSDFKQLLDDLKADYPNIVFDPSQCPDIHLYTGIHFNLLIKGQGDLVAMGGRYDNLYNSFLTLDSTSGSSYLPAIGFAYYMPRFISALESQGLIPELSSEHATIKIEKNWKETLKSAQEAIKKGGSIKLK